MMNIEKKNNTLWRKKATAFAVRSHRHLWGKNNEDPLAFLFRQGLKNQFVKDHYLGWNKFSQERPYANWGFTEDPEGPRNFGLPPGIVVPLIQEKTLISTFIQTYDESGPKEVFMLPGSENATLVFGMPNPRVVVLNQLMDGLLLFQEKGLSTGIVIHPVPDIPLSHTTLATLKNAGSLLYLKKEKDAAETPAPSLSVEPRIRSYKTVEEMISMTNNI